MATRNRTTKQARRFSAIKLGNGKQITPIRTEFGDMEYEAMYNGCVVATTLSEADARNAINEYVYDFERERRFLSLDEQIETIGTSKNRFQSDDITIGVLPTGETITRPVSDGAPADWISVSRGHVELSISAGGEISGVSFAGYYFTASDFTASDIENLRALLLLDPATLGTVAELSSDVTRAIQAWYAMNVITMEQVIQSIGFGAWYGQQMQMVKAA